MPSQEYTSRMVEGPITRAEKAEAEVKRLLGELAECYCATGADPEGMSSATMAKEAVRAVRDLLRSDDRGDEVARLKKALTPVADAAARLTLREMLSVGLSEGMISRAQQALKEGP
jgi:hypothetical protein